MESDRWVVADTVISASQIDVRVAEIAQQIDRYYGDRSPLCIGVLTGAYVVMADLLRRLTIDVEVEFMAVSSYGDATESSGAVQILKDLNTPIRGRDVLVVEDIIDSGLTLEYLLNFLGDREPADIKVFALLRKPDAVAVDVQVDWVGFDIADEFVVGYGLDVAGRYRNLPYVGIVSRGPGPD